MQHRQIRSDRTRFRETSPVRSLGASEGPNHLPGSFDARPSFHQPRHKGARGPCTGKASLGSLQEASFQRQVQDQAESLPSYRPAPASAREIPRRSLSEKALPQHFALEGETRHKLLPEHPPQLEHMMLKIEILQKVVRKLARGRLPPTLEAELAADDCKPDRDNNNNRANNNNNNNNNHITNNNNNNSDDNNHNNNNKIVKSLA